jgi:hypothetical protein
MRLADIVPECLRRDDPPIDGDECQAFFGARREVMLERNPIPFTPLTREQSERWQRYLRSTGAGKLIRAKPAVTPLKRVTESVTIKPPRVTESPPVILVTAAKRGRPKSGEALSDAERARRARAKRKKAER